MAKTKRYKNISKKLHPGMRKLAGDRMAFQRRQLQRACANMDALVEHIENELTPDAIEAVLSEMQTLAKSPARPGAWQDRTGNLRDSIQVEVLDPHESRNVNYKHGSTQAVNDSNQTIGVLYAGMEYAAPLEAKSGYSVLGYAVESLKKRLTPMLVKKLKLGGSARFA